MVQGVEEGEHGLLSNVHISVWQVETLLEMHVVTAMDAVNATESIRHVQVVQCVPCTQGPHGLLVLIAQSTFLSWKYRPSHRSTSCSAQTGHRQHNKAGGWHMLACSAPGTVGVYAGSGSGHTKPCTRQGAGLLHGQWACVLSVSGLVHREQGPLWPGSCHSDLHLPPLIYSFPLPSRAKP